MGAAKSNKKTIKRFKGIRIAVFVFLILWCSSFYLSSSWIFLNSFKSRIQFLLDKTGWPKPFLFANYPAALNNLEAGGKNLFSMLFNSLWLTFGNISVQVITSVMFAYALARYRFFGRNAMYWTVIVMMMLTIVGALPAQYKLYLNLGIYDTPLIILTGASGTAHFLIYYAAFKGLPWSYAESAFIDGASHLTVFFRIMLPQVNGVITAMCVTSFIINWNE
jgi:raffinose/stachyose/melibiose transport system permease protein/N-acetylglucosamine transport system permease protein